MTPPIAVYEGLHRRFGFFLGMLSVLLLIVAAGAYIAVRSPGEEGMPALAVSLAVFLAGMVFAAMASFHMHRWELHGDRLEVFERPKFRLLGRTRRASVPFAAIRALQATKSGLDETIEVETTDSRRYQLKYTMGTLPEFTSGIAPDSGLTAFAARIQETMRAAGRTPPPLVQRLGFLETPLGFLIVAVLFLLSLALAGVVLWALWDGMSRTLRMGDAIAMVLLLPVALAFMLRRAWKRRRAVLAARPAQGA